MTKSYSEDELRDMCARIRKDYNWLDERTIERFAEQALKNKYNGNN